MSVFATSFFNGFRTIQTTSDSVALLINTSPVWTVVLAVIRLRERLLGHVPGVGAPSLIAILVVPYFR